MISRHSIVSRLSSLLLVLLLMLPAAFQLAHAFEGHEHTSCDEITTHIHEKKLECDLCDFQLSTFTWTLNSLAEFTSSDIQTKDVFTLKISLKTEDQSQLSLRGPPLRA